jgi:hypothetical protein
MIRRPRILFQKLLALALALVVAGCASSHGLKPGRTKIGSKQVVVPAQIVGNQFVVEMKWDKHGPWHFLVDTGSSVTLVSEEFAKRYGTGKAALGTPSVHVKSSDGKSTLLPSVTLGFIELDDARFDNVQALVLDCAEISAHLGIKIDGVLGFPFFQDTVFTLDYPQSHLVLARVSPMRETSPSRGTTIKFTNSQRTPFIPVRLGAENFIALIDSGNDGPLLLNLIGLHPRFSFGPRPGVTVGTLTGNRTQEIGRLEQPLDIGPYRFEKPIVDLTDQISSIGGEILRNFAVTFDQSRNQVTFYRDSALPIPAQTRRAAGISFSKMPTYWRVAGVIPDSPADALGIQSGDLVIRINGESVNDWNLRRYEAVVRRANEITYTFLNGTKETPIVVPTFELVP